MPIYQTSKQLTKFGLVGISAVCVDLFIYYILSQFMNVDLSKALGFFSGTFVTYNLNKYWTWRQTDKSNLRLLWFVILYTASMLINVGVNSLSLDFLPDTEVFIMTSGGMELLEPLFAMKMDKFIAFFIATAFSSIFNFIGQKYWVFKDKTEDESEEATEDQPSEPQS